MKSFIEARIRFMTGEDKPLHPALHRFMERLEERYRNCGMPGGIREDHMPLIMCLMDLADIPLFQTPEEEAAASNNKKRARAKVGA